MQSIKRKLVAGAAAAVMLTTPMTAFAANHLVIESPAVGAQSVTVGYSGVKEGDWYHLFVGDRFFAGRLTQAGVAAGKMAINLDAPLANGTIIRFDMPADGQGQYLSQSLVVGQPSSTPEPPASGVKENGLYAEYPASAHPGEQVVPRIYLVTDGQSRDVSAEAEYAVSGPIKTGTFANGGFTVAGDAPAGSQVLVTIFYGNETKKVTVPVKQADGGATEGAVDLGELTLSRQTIAAASPQQITITPERFPANAGGAFLNLRYSSNPQAVTAVQVDNLATMVNEKAVRVTVQSSQNALLSYDLIFTDNHGQEIKRLPFEIFVGSGRAEKGQVRMEIGLKTIDVGGTYKHIDADPFIQNGRTFVPLRALAEAFGAKVDYDDPTRTITITEGKNTVRMVIGQKAYSVNGAPKTMDISPYVSNGGRTILPVRYAAEALGYHVDITTDHQGLTQSIIFTNK